jgi:AraC-like DNA-binding protein
MRIDVRSLLVNEKFNDLSKSFNVPIRNEGGELAVEIPKVLGTGFIHGINFDSGIGIMWYYCKFNQDVSIHFIFDAIHPLKFIFCSEGQVGHTFQDQDDFHNIETYQNIIVSNSGNNGHVLHFKANVQTRVSSLEILRSKFSQHSNYNFQDLDPGLKKLFEDTISEKPFIYQGHYSIISADLMDEMISKKYRGFLRAIFLEGKSLEMLVIQISQYHDDQSRGNWPKTLRKSDIKKVDYVASRIIANLGYNFTVESLAKEAGTNINKLQEGFKHEYNLTVNKYMQTKKLEAAKEMLMTSEKNISEIVTAIGLNNRSYFSKIFKEKYGVNPNYFLKTRKNKIGN